MTLSPWCLGYVRAILLHVSIRRIERPIARAREIESTSTTLQALVIHANCLAIEYICDGCIVYRYTPAALSLFFIPNCRSHTRGTLTCDTVTPRRHCNPPYRLQSSSPSRESTRYSPAVNSRLLWLTKTRCSPLP